MQIGFIDHYDSFSHNLIDWLLGLDPSLKLLYARWDVPHELDQIRRSNVPIVVSPGPGSPEAVVPTLNLLKESVGVRPVLGVCLGHQILGRVLNIAIKRVHRPVHGSTVLVEKSSQPSRTLVGMPQTFYAAVYNSLCLDVAEGESRPKSSHDLGWVVTARAQDGQVMGIETTSGPLAAGLQFHPESFLSGDTSPVGRAWLAECRRWDQRSKS